MKTPRRRILAIEADPERSARLQRLLREKVDADITVACSGEVAVRSIKFQVPDLVVASMLLPPGDEAQVMAHLKAIDGATSPAVLVVPPLHAETHLTAGRRLMLHLGVGSAAPFPLYDADAIGVRIQEALEESSGRPRERRALLRGGDTGESALALAPTRTTLKPHDQSAPSAPLVRPSKPVIERAHRWSPAELPWVCSVQVPPGIDTRIINLSRTGILIESGSKLGVGSVTGVHLWGPDTALVVPARVVRSDVASVAAAGVRYWIAAAFNGRLDTVPEAVAQPTPLAFSPRSLAELLARIAAQVDRGQRAGDVKAMFEEGVRQLTSAQEVKIRETPALANDRESVYFKVPDPFGRRAVLQVIFEAGHEPGAEEFMLLKAAAASAALVLQPQPTPPHQARKGGQRNSW